MTDSNLILDLNLESAFLIWVIRQGDGWNRHAGNADHPPDLTAFFGTELVTQGQHACELLQAGLRGRRGEIGQVSDPAMTPLETSLVRLLARMHERTEVATRAVHRLMDCSADTAQTAVIYGCYLIAVLSRLQCSRDANRSVRQRFRPEGHCRMTAPSPVGTSLILGIRIWLRAWKAGRDPMGAILNELPGSPPCDVWLNLSFVLSHLCMVPRRPLELAANLSEPASADERRLIASISALQHHDMATSLSFLRDLLPPAAARACVEPLTSVAQSLMLKGMMLPDPVDASDTAQARLLTKHSIMASTSIH